MNAASRMTAAQPTAMPPAGEQPTIRTERLVLRPPRVSDAGLIEHYMADRRLAEGTRTVPHPLPSGAVEAWLARATGATATARAPQDTMPEQASWVIDGTESGLAEVLGLVTLHHVSPGQCELEFWIGHGLWNTGFATEAVAALIEANPCRCRSMVAEAFQDNPASARVLTHCGFGYLGDAESFSVARNARVATWTYARAMG